MARPGLTLTELMVVTVIISVLALVVSPYFERARTEAMMAAATAELASAIRFVEVYQSFHNALPSSYEELSGVGHIAGRDTEVCLYQSFRDVGGRDNVRIELRHRGVAKGVITEYPRLAGAIWETNPSTCEVGDAADDDWDFDEPPADDLDDRPGRRLGQRRR